MSDKNGIIINMNEIMKQAPRWDLQTAGGGGLNPSPIQPGKGISPKLYPPDSKA